MWARVDGAPLEVRVTGEDYEWHVAYPGPDDRLDTPDDIVTRRHVHLPAETSVRLQLRSRDYVYSLALPHLQLREIAVPELAFALEFPSGPVGRHELMGDQLCGSAHPLLEGELIVEPPERFERWLRETDRGRDGGDEPSR